MPRARRNREDVGVVVKRCEVGYAESLAALIAAIERRGLTVFARIDHGAGAREAGLELAEEEVVVFGDPRGGTPLMQADRRVGIELPLRALVWSDGGATFVGYSDPRELAREYELAGCEDVLERLAGLLDALSDEARAPRG
jgi:uncharacterized protein (DUF302 family)